jgi:hypothetical protein
MSDTIHIDRDTLYRRVWELPTTALAKEYGISDVALAKICRKMKIPKPPPGYWRRLETGYKTEIPPLPAAEKGTPLRTSIYVPNAADKMAENNPQVAQLLAAEQMEVNRIRVDDQLTNPHPLIAAFKNARSGSRRGSDTESKGLLVDIDASDGTIDRALRIMDAVLKALESRGYQVVVSKDYWGTATRIHCAGVDVELQISISERFSKVERELSDEERKKPPYLLNDRFVTVASGKLIFSASTRSGTWATWQDRKLQPLQDRLNEVAAGIISKLEGLRLQEIEKLEAERRRIEEQKRRAEEQARRSKLYRDAAKWRKCERLRS